MNRRTFNQLISESNFRELFITEMGWNNPSGATILPDYTVDEHTFSIEQIAERSGFQILQCRVDCIPASSLCKKLDTKLRKNAENYICIFVIPGTTHHLWVVPVKKVEKRDLVLVEYDTVDLASFLFEKMEGLSFSLEDSTPTILDVIEKVQGAFLINSERVTRDFYRGFKQEHTNFVKFISGIDDHIADKDNRNKQWYTSVMLNRLMFCYFIQKKGFLNGDVDYLRHKLEWTQQNEGKDRFFNKFYKGFLLNLFHDGLNAPKHDAEFEAVYGRIPYLNGGMFDIHQIESEYTEHDIADEAFVSLFDFFDRWHWHLDDRMTASGRDINPDVLGYIFEQYINDRAQMGAYYTKEDITEYIGRNTIVPHLIDAVREKDENLLKPDAEIWRFLRDSGDRYIFDAVKKGKDLPIPEDISMGIDTTQPNLLERRDHWNDRTPDEFALPTEIWRETIERLQRYKEKKAKIENGEITSINEFITYNLDIRQFIYDFLAHTSNRLFIEKFYDALQHVTILDPTCGSGAFLFAALNILEPLYEVCVVRMQEFHEQDPNLFTNQLHEIQNKYRSNIQYFIYKSIILRNLYGVDIMVEATEIAKLRLFLKMVAVVEVDKRDSNMGLDPLPDIDFNIRCGNTLVGYATEKEMDEGIAYTDIFTAQEFRDKVNEQMKEVSKTYDVFRAAQLEQTEDTASFKQAKFKLKEKLASLNSLLNHQMYGSVDSNINYDSWLHANQPFHWIAEFYEIINGNGGFDVIIGNPPYVVYNQRKIGYSIRRDFETFESSNLYSYVFERSFHISQSRIGLIVQMSAISIESMDSLQSFLMKKTKTLYYSIYPERPKQLFDGACIALSIIICDSQNGNNDIFGSGISRFSDIQRATLFKKLSYLPIYRKDFLSGYKLFPKFGSKIEQSINAKFNQDSAISKYFCSNNNSNVISYRTAGGRYWKPFINREFATATSTNKTQPIVSEIPSVRIVAVLNSNLFWWFYANYFDLFHLTKYMFSNFNYTDLKDCISDDLQKLGEELMSSFEKNKILNKQFIKTQNRETVFESFNPQLSKSIIDNIDMTLAKHYGFTEEELDFIINYDIKYRMGDELDEE